MSIADDAEFAEHIAQTIHERTFGYLREFRLSTNANVVIVQAIAPSYYLKQLALEAARAALRGLPHRIRLEITVHAC